MTSTPPEPEDHEPTIPLAEDGWGPGDSSAPPPPPGGTGYPPPGYGPPPGYAPPPPHGYVYGARPDAPWGVHPATGVPYSDKQKVLAGLLQILLPFGIGRFYIGDTGIGVAQLLVTIFTCGLGGIWTFIDGIIMLTGDPKDPHGRPLRP